MKSAQFVRDLVGEVELSKRPSGPLFNRLCRFVPLRRIESRADYRRAVRVVTALSEKIVGSGEGKAAADILAYTDTLGLLIENYEKKAFPNIGRQCSGAQVLAFLMEQNGLKQADLARYLGGQSTVSEILSGKRKLNADQMGALAGRFSVSPAVFFGPE